MKPKTELTESASLETQLFDAIKNKNLEQIEKLVLQGASLAAKDEKGQTPIQAAKVLLYWECIEFIALLKKTDSKDSYNYGSVLLAAVRYNKLSAARSLLQAGAPLTWCSVEGENHCAHWAVKNDNIPLLTVLLQNDCPLECENADKKTPIELAMELGHLKCAEAIASIRNTDRKDSYAYGSALLKAVRGNHLELARRLLHAGASTNWYNPNEGNDILHTAAFSDNPELVRLLLSYPRLDPRKTNGAGKTALELACLAGNWNSAEVFVQYFDTYRFSFKDGIQASRAYWAAVKAGKLDIAEKLLGFGAYPDTTKGDSNTGLHWLVKEWNNLKLNSKIAAYLIKKNFDQALDDQEGKTAIELASELQQWDGVQFLIEIEALDPQNQKRSQALHYEKVLINSIKHNNYEFAKLLLSKGVSCNPWNAEQGNICLYWAIKNNNPLMLSLLMEHQADITRRNAKGLTALESAVELKHVNCILQLMNASLSPLSINLETTEFGPEILDLFREKAWVFFHSMVDKTIANEKIPEAIENFQNSFFLILNNHCISLRKQRLQLQANSQAFNLSSINMKEEAKKELDKISDIINAINVITKQPDQILTLKPCWDVNTRIGSDIQDYLVCKTKIDDYILRLTILIKNVELKIQQIKEKQSFFDQYKINSDLHLQKFAANIKKLSQVPGSQQTLEVYKGLIAIFRDISIDISELPAYLKAFHSYVSVELRNMNFIPSYTIGANPPLVAPTDSNANTAKEAVIIPLPVSSTTTQKSGTLLDEQGFFSSPKIDAALNPPTPLVKETEPTDQVSFFKMPKQQEQDSEPLLQKIAFSSNKTD